MSTPQFTAYIPEFLNQVTPTSNGLAVAQSSPSQTLAAEVVTSLPISTGARRGGRFYLDQAQAVSLSSTAFPCGEGWYRIVLVDSGATAANINYGTIGAVVSIAKGFSTVTDAANVLSLGVAPVIFLGTVVVGQYTIVQDLTEGNENLLAAISQTVSVGSVLVSTATGQVAVIGTWNAADFIAIVGIAEKAVTTPGSLTLTAAAAPVGGTSALTGTITNGTSNAYAGGVAVVSGFSNAANNGIFAITASSTTVLTVQNPNAIAETHAGAVSVELFVPARLGAPFAY